METRRKKPSWSIGSIHAVVKNTHYIGHYTHTDKSVDEIVEIPCPAFMNITVWNDCQRERQIILKRKGQVNRTTHFYLLRDFMMCGYCETPMGARTKISKSSLRGNENFYYCPKKECAWVKDAPKDDEK